MRAIQQAKNYLQKVHRHEKIRRSHTIHLGEQGLGYRILHSRFFDLVFGAVILCNFGVVIIETDAVALGEKAPAWVHVVSWTILCSFVVELALRLYVMQCSFWFDAYNNIDFCLVALDLIMNLLGFIAGSAFPVSFLRIVRLSKLARLAKVFHVFPELQLMMAGLLGALRAIMWGTVLLVFFVITWSIIAVQLIHPLNEEIAKTNEYDGCDRCSRAYSNVFQSALTISQQIIAGDSWGLVSISVIEHYPASAIFFALVFLSVGLAILNLILGVVVDVASQAREQMKDDLEAARMLARQESESHLLEQVRELDVDQSGKISRREITKGYEENPEFRRTLELMEISEEDLQVLWTLLDMEGAGSVSYADLVTKLYKLKTSDTQFVLAYIKHYIIVMKKQICHEMEVIKELCAEMDKVRNLEAERLEVEKSSQSFFRNMYLERHNSDQFEDVMDVMRDEGICSTDVEAQRSLKDGDVEKSCDVQNTAELHGVVKEPVAQFNEELTACSDGKRSERRVANGVAKCREQCIDKLDECAATQAAGVQSKKHIKKDVCKSPDDLAPCQLQALLNLLESSHKQHVELTASMKVVQEQIDMLVSPTLRTAAVSTGMTMPHLLDPSQSFPSGSRTPLRDQTVEPWSPFPSCFGGNTVKVAPLTPKHVLAPPRAV